MQPIMSARTGDPRDLRAASQRRAPRWGAAAAGLVLLTCAGSGAAQVDFRSGSPIDITANEAEVVQSKCMAVWRGAAEALQGDSRLRADTITVYARPKASAKEGHARGAAAKAGGADDAVACGATDRVVADGRVFYVTPTQNARGDHAVYTAADDQIVLTGDVVVAQGDDVARGDRLTIKVSTKQATLDAGAGGNGGRVRGVFYPQKNADSDKAEAGAAKP